MIIILAIINSIIWTYLTIRWQRLRRKDINPVSAYGLVCSGLPFWLITILILNRQYDLVYSEKYFINLFFWFALCAATNIGGLFILKFKALSELGIYKLAISTLVAMLIDFLFFKNSLSAPIFMGVILLLISGFLLPKNNNNKKKDLKLSTTWLLLLSLGITGALQFAVYKNALILQASPLLHAMFAQTILYSLFLIASFKSLQDDFKSGKIKIKDFIIFGALIYIYTVIEAFLFKELPVTLLVTLTVLSILLFQIYDVKNKELKNTWQLYAATCLAIIAIFIIMLK